MAIRAASPQEALQWCNKHIVEWPIKIPSIRPHGWRWVQQITGKVILVRGTRYWLEQADFIAIRLEGLRESINVNGKKPVTHYRDQHYPAGVSWSRMMEDLYRG